MKPYRPDVKLAKQFYSLRWTLKTAATRESRAGKADPEQQRAVDREAADG